MPSAPARSRSRGYQGGASRLRGAAARHLRLPVPRLVQRRSRRPVDGDFVSPLAIPLRHRRVSLEIPGGVIDPGEEPIIAAARELKEETGYDARPSSSSRVGAEPRFPRQPLLHVPRARLSPRRGDAFDDEEDLETVLVKKKDLAALLDSGQITHALVSGPLETYLRRMVFHASSSSTIHRRRPRSLRSSRYRSCRARPSLSALGELARERAAEEVAAIADPERKD